MNNELNTVIEQEEKPAEELTTQELDQVAGGAVDIFLKIRGIPEE
jgi:bacteriocin-like protein